MEISLRIRYTSSKNYRRSLLNRRKVDGSKVHIDRTSTLTSSTDGETTAAARKLKHRLTDVELEKAMDEVEKT